MLSNFRQELVPLDSTLRALEIRRYSAKISSDFHLFSPRNSFYFIYSRCAARFFPEFLSPLDFRSVSVNIAQLCCRIFDRNSFTLYLLVRVVPFCPFDSRYAAKIFLDLTPFSLVTPEGSLLSVLQQLCCRIFY